MADSISFNTGNIRELAKYVVDVADKYLSKIEEVSSNVVSLGSDWQGETYNTFKASYDTNKARIEELADQLRTIANGLETVANQGDDTTNRIISRMG